MVEGEETTQKQSIEPVVDSRIATNEVVETEKAPEVENEATSSSSKPVIIPEFGEGDLFASISFSKLEGEVRETSTENAEPVVPVVPKLEQFYSLPDPTKKPRYVKVWSIGQSQNSERDPLMVSDVYNIGRVSKFPLVTSEFLSLK